MVNSLVDEDRHSITGTRLRATVLAAGAELCSLTADGEELMWQAGAAWPKHAPVLFPTVGTLTGNRLLHHGVSYPMGRHGFAREQRFAWAERTASSCRLVLEDNASTRAVFPFAFRLELGFAIAGDVLEVAYVLTNPGAEVLPAAMGGHPAFNWPLRAEVAKDAYGIEFAADEPAPIRRVGRDGLLLDEAFATPVRGRHLALNEAIFAADAIIMERPASRSLRYAGPEGPAIEFSWDDGFPSFGIWSPPGVGLLCLEPWHGMSSPAGFDGAFIDKPGIMRLAPGESRRAAYRVGLG